AKSVPQAAAFVARFTAGRAVAAAGTVAGGVAAVLAAVLGRPAAEAEGADASLDVAGPEPVGSITPEAEEIRSAA
ncbi:MAG TPA: hypothetical protein VF796_29280, partial [Humisphaera sp.]